MVCRALIASRRQRSISPRTIAASGSSFFNGWRSTPGTVPATSQLLAPISTTATKVVDCSKEITERLKSFTRTKDTSIRSPERRWCHNHRRRPIASPTLGGDGKANAWPWVKDLGLREEVIGQLCHPLPREAVLLTAAPQRAQPEAHHIVAESA